MSTCIAVIPSFVPPTLKSISPKKSSIPCMSVSIIYLSGLFLSVTSPVEIPATGFLIGTPASIKASVLPHMLACDVEPFEDKTSETTLIEYGNSSSEGITGTSAFSANAPCPISLLPGPLEGLASPTLYDGKLYWCIYLFESSSSNPSSICSSLFIPNVTIDITCVWPLVNIALPWTLGNTPTSQERGLISSIFLPSGRLCSSKIISLTHAFSKSCMLSAMSVCFSCANSSPFFSIK